MHRVAIIGHRAGTFHIDEELLKSKTMVALEIMAFQYDKDLVLLADGEPGVGHFAINNAKELGVKYHMFLPCPLGLVGGSWLDEQRESFKQHFNGSYSTTICSSKLTADSEVQRDHSMVDTSNFVICFWEGRHQGRTYEAIKYALKNNKLVLNGLDELKMISNNDMQNGVADGKSFQ